MKKIFVLAAFCYVANAEAQPVKKTFENGKIIFQNNCIGCHGHDGKLGKHGAKNLQISKLNDSKLLKIVSDGKWVMPKWKNILTSEQLSAVIMYVKTLRNN
jgi:cytochrome c6